VSGDVDSIIIGAGHNGLVCATLLARAGQRVLVLEAAGHPGGALRTREFAPGFQVSAGAHLLHHFPGTLLAELDLIRHGLRFAAEAMPTVMLRAGGAHVTLHGHRATGVSAAEATAYAAFHARMDRFATRFLQVLQQTPPRIDAATRADQIGLLRLGWWIRSLGRDRMRDLLRIIGMPVHDLAEECFTDAALQAAIGFGAVLGNDAGPRAPGTVLNWLYRASLEQAAGARGTCQVQGGMGALGVALANAATAAKVELKLNTRVARITVAGDRATGVALEDGRLRGARRVISAASPRATFMQLLGAEHLDAGFTRRVAHLRARGHAAKLHLALSAAPVFHGLAPAAHGDRLVIAPDLAAIEHAYNPIKYGELPAAPIMEISIPTVRDPSLAPAGQHVLSAIVQFVPHDTMGLPDGWRDRFITQLVAQLARYAPGLPAHVLHAELLMPADLQDEFGLDGGHWHHGELTMDQFYFNRPLPGAAQYQAPVAGLFLCGAGSHPGGGIAGIAGQNAARHILTHDR